MFTTYIHTRSIYANNFKISLFFYCTTDAVSGQVRCRHFSSLLGIMIHALPALLLRFDVDPVLKRQGTHQVLPKDRLSDLPENMRDEPDVVIVRRRRSPDLRFPLVCPGSLY